MGDETVSECPEPPLMGLRGVGGALVEGLSQACFALGLQGFMFLGQKHSLLCCHVLPVVSCWFCTIRATKRCQSRR